MRTLSSRSDFERVFTCGRRYNHPLMRMVIRDAENEGDPGRVAFAAPKRLGHAVLRNRAKRVLRASAQACGFPLAGRDVILFATRGTATAPHDDLVHALEGLVRRAEAGHGR